jgi:transcriptional regulator GlxA family with amidase domain
MSDQSERRVDLLAFQNFQLLDIAGPMQVFATANRVLEDAGRAPVYRLRIIARQGQTMAWAGLTLLSEPLPDADEPCDTLVIAGGDAVQEALRDPELVAWIVRKAPNTRRIASICTGAFLAGTAGLLDGRRAVTHWDSCDLLARTFPAAKVEPDPIFIEDGKLWTSAGVTAGIDLALALVERDLGRAVAMAVARDLVVFLKRPGGQSQFSGALSAQQAVRPALRELQAWIPAHLGDDLSVAALAARACLSERSFARAFRAEVGQSPAAYVETLRVERARTLLEDGAESLEVVTRATGFSSPEILRRAFHRRVGVSPAAYRERFRLAA